MARRWFTGRMTHTCTIERDSGTAQSASGEIQESWSDAGTMAGRFVETRERVASEGVGFAMLKTHLWLCDAGADVAVDDRITDIEDADGDTIDAGPFTIEELLRRRGIDGDVHHLTLVLERVERAG